MKMSSNVEIPVSRKDVVSFAHIYNLDWSLVPKHKSNPLKLILITLASIIVMTGIAYALINYLNTSETNETIKENTELNNTTPESQETTPEAATSDSIAIKEKPTTKDNKKNDEKPAKQEEPEKQENKEEKEPEKPVETATEETYDPIY